MHRNFFVSCFNDFVSFKSLFNGWFEALWSCTLCCLFYLKPVWADGVKSSPIFSESCPKSSQYSFFIIVRFFEIAQKVINHLGFFCYKFCCQDLSKIAQSGHTGLTIVGKFSATKNAKNERAMNGLPALRDCLLFWLPNWNWTMNEKVFWYPTTTTTTTTPRERKLIEQTDNSVEWLTGREEKHGHTEWKNTDLVPKLLLYLHWQLMPSWLAWGWSGFLVSY